MSLTFLLNPKRKHGPIRRWLARLGTGLGFLNVDYAYVHGPPERVRVGERVSFGTNALFNTNSGEITIGDDTIFGHNCMVLAGTHRFVNGRRAKLVCEDVRETPEHGYDVRIGSGVFVASGAIVIGPVTIGDDCLIAAGAVVVKDVPAGSLAAGNPARVVKSLKPPAGATDQSVMPGGARDSARAAVVTG